MTDINQFILNRLDKLDEKLDDIKIQNTHTEAFMKTHESRDEERHQDVINMGVQLQEQSKLLSEYNDSLREHIRRTEILEERVDRTDSRLKPIEKDFNEKKSYDSFKSKQWKKWAAVLGIAGAITAALAGLAEFLNYLGLFK